MQDYNVLYTDMGDFTRYHVIQYLLCFLIFAYVPMEILTAPFTTAHPGYFFNHTFISCENITLNQSFSTFILNYSTVNFQRTIVTSFNLTCLDKKLTQLSPTIFLFGMYIGCYITGSLMDRYGRKSLTVISSVFVFLFNMSSAFSPNLAFYLMSRFCIGFGCNALIAAVSNIILENIATNYRGIASMGLAFGWSAGIASASLVAYISQGDYVKIHLYMGFYCLILGLIFMSITTESLRWLYVSHDQETHLLYSIKKINFINGKGFKILPEWIKNRKDKVEENENNLSLKEADKLLEDEAPLDIEIKQSRFICLKFPKNTTMLGILSYLGFTNNLVYYTFTLGVVSSSDNIYTQTVYGALMEYPATIMVIVASTRIGRIPLMFLLILSSLLMTLIGSDIANLKDIYPAPMGLIKQIAFLLGRTFVSGIGTTLFTYGGEVVPTQVRGFGVSFLNSFGSAGALLAPQIYLLRDLWTPFPLLVVSISQVLSSILVLTLAETRNRGVMDTLKENENYLNKATRFLSYDKGVKFNYRALDFGAKLQSS